MSENHANPLKFEYPVPHDYKPVASKSYEASWQIANKILGSFATLSSVNLFFLRVLQSVVVYSSPFVTTICVIMVSVKYSSAEIYAIFAS